MFLPYNYATDDAVTSIIPGMAGEDYHIYAEVPESGFVCDGQVTMLTLRLNEKHSTFAQLMELQNYFICDWWFNLDCSAAEDYYSLKNEITALPRMKALAEAAAADIQKNMAPY